MSTALIIGLSVAITLGLCLFFLVFGIAFLKLRQFVRETVALIENVSIMLKEGLEIGRNVTMHLDLARRELGWLRQQSGVGEAAEIPTPPPIGKASKMPPAFPTHPYFVEPPDAKVEDTDQSLLNQSEEEMMQAEIRADMRARGIEPMEGGPDEQAVREDA